MQFTDQLRGWLSTSLLGVIAFVVIKGMAMMLKNQIENRNATIEERRQEREGYGPLINTMREEMKRITDLHHDCESRMRASEARISSLEGELAGYHRQLIMRSAHEIMTVPPSEPSQMVRDAARRVIDIVSDEQE